MKRKRTADSDENKSKRPRENAQRILWSNSFKGKNVHFGLSVSDPVLHNTISNFSNKLINSGLDRTFLVPINRLHVTLAKLNLIDNLEDLVMYEKLATISFSVFYKFRKSISKLKIRDFVFDGNSRSVKLYLTKKSSDLINTMRLYIIETAKIVGITHQDRRKYKPHITVLDQLYGNLTDDESYNIKEAVRNFSNKIMFRTFLLKDIKILTPRFHSSLDIEDQKMANLAETLTVDFSSL